MAFAGAVFLFSKLNHTGYEADFKQHNKAKEKQYKNEVRQKN